MTIDAPLDDLVRVGLPVYEALEQRERHPHSSRLIEGATLREYQAHLTPWGGPPALKCLYGDGVLFAGDPGKINARLAVGSWPSMASGIAAARTVQHALEKGDFCTGTLSAYSDFLAEDGLVEVLAEAHRSWLDGHEPLRQMAAEPDTTFRLASRYLNDVGDPASPHEHSVLADFFCLQLARPCIPSHARPMRDETASLDRRHRQCLQEAQDEYKGW